MKKLAMALPVAGVGFVVVLARDSFVSADVTVC